MKLITGIIAFLLTGCAYYPKQIEYYDAECNITYKKLILKNSEFGMRQGSCQNEACIATLLSIPVQALVAGSIVVAGNTVFWLEKEGKCILKE